MNSKKRLDNKIRRVICLNNTYYLKLAHEYILYVQVILSGVRYDKFTFWLNKIRYNLTTPENTDIRYSMIITTMYTGNNFWKNYVYAYIKNC